MSKAITADPTETTTATDDTCPSCGATLANVQGIADCVGCSFSAD